MFNVCVWCKTNTTIFTLHLITATRTIKKNNLEQIESYQFSPLSQPKLAVIDTKLSSKNHDNIIRGTKNKILANNCLITSLQETVFDLKT